MIHLMTGRSVGRLRGRNSAAATTDDPLVRWSDSGERNKLGEETALPIILFTTPTPYVAGESGHSKKLETRNKPQHVGAHPIPLSDLLTPAPAIPLGPSVRRTVRRARGEESRQGQGHGAGHP